MNRQNSTIFLCYLALSLFAAPPVGARETAENAVAPVDFSRDVYPLLQRSCFECHGESKQEGGLRLDLRSEALESGSIEVGQPESSELLRRLRLPRGHDEVMPAIGDPLSKQQIETIRLWIEQGAAWPEDFEQPPHWSYVTPKRAVLPIVTRADWPQTPIDHFVLHHLEEAGLAPSLPADPAKLVRRLFLDLIGLPPTPQEVDAFVSDPTQANYERLIEELCNRPQFGERWARPWLDLARYADSHGFQRDDLRDSWAYRDWVIQALNADMPFDQFTIEQIAGDLLPNATESQKIATGFHRCAPTNIEGGTLPEENRAEQVLDRVNTTGAIWLGTTLECCQCHDHKYDPFSIKEYYSLLAFYNSTELEADLAVPHRPSSIKFKGPRLSIANPERDRQRKKAKHQLTVVKKQRSKRSQELDSQLEAWAAAFAQHHQNRPQSHVLDVIQFHSQGTTDTFKKLDDGSVLLAGRDPPGSDVYTFRSRAQLNQIFAFRLEALQHDSLPGKGPGRGDSVQRNFVLNDFSVELLDGSSRPLKLNSAKASFSQSGWDVAGAIDENKKTGWAISPQFDESHWATFSLSEPFDLHDSSELDFTLTQSEGNAQTMGRFRILAITGGLDTEPVSSEVLKIASKPTAEWSKSDRKKLLNHCLSEDESCKSLTKEIAVLETQHTALAADTTLVMVELKEPRKSHVFMRGDYKSPGEPTVPATPAVLHALPEGPPNRLTLAQWLVSPQNPLVARVVVNRWWAELFGQGIVTTAEDFGIKGEPPTHPELLDWLAVEFMENGWSMKSLLKTIVSSATYQQSSWITPELLERDDRNQQLARGPRLRMDAEMIRDNALAISGLLDLKQFGRPIQPYQPAGLWSKVGGVVYNYKVSPGSEQYRRGVYVVLKRGSPYPSFVNFDATARLACTVMRSRSNTPLQALTILNDPVYVAAARAMAERIRIEQPGSSVPEKLDYAFKLCVARKPTVTEQATLLQLYNTQLAASTETDAWFSIATTLLNLHETITKD